MSSRRCARLRRPVRVAGKPDHTRPAERASPGPAAGFPLANLQVTQGRSSRPANVRRRVRAGGVSCSRNGLFGSLRLTGPQVLAVLRAADAEAIRMARRAEHLIFFETMIVEGGGPVDAAFNTILQEELGLDLNNAGDRQIALRQSERYRRIADAMEGGIIRYVCRSPRCDPDEFAFAFPANRLIRLCTPFWTDSEGGLSLAQNQAGTLLHEVSHVLFDMDHDNRLRRANSDCFESFALRVAGHAAPRSCVNGPT